MKYFLTSSPIDNNSDGFYEVNGFREKFISSLGKKINMLFVASDPDNYPMSSSFAKDIASHLEKEGVEFPAEEPVELYVGILGKEARGRAYHIVSELRKQGMIVETDYMDRSAKAQMKYANKIGAKRTVIIGTQELEENKARVKDMETGEQTEVSLDQIASLILQNK